MKMRTIFHLDVSDYPFAERKAMLEVIAGRLRDHLEQYFPAERGYTLSVDAGDANREGWWNIHLARGNAWRFRLSLEIDDRGSEKLFLISLGRDLDKSGISILLGMAASLVGLSVALMPDGQPFTGDMIAPLVIGTVIGGLILSLPIRLMIRPFAMTKARNAGVEEAERQLIERINEVLGHAGLLF